MALDILALDTTASPWEARVPAAGDTYNLPRAVAVELSTGATVSIAGDGSSSAKIVSDSALSIGQTPHSTFIAGTSVFIEGGLLKIADGSQDDLRLYRDAANTLALRNSTNAQAFNIYNTYTDATNYERGYIKWDSNILTIGTEAGGTGSDRDVKVFAAKDLYLENGTGDKIYFVDSNVSRTVFDGGIFYPLFPGNLAVAGLGKTGNGWPQLWFSEVDADPADPAEGESVMWQSDGTGSGDDGDIMMKITAGGTTKTVTLIDFSAA